jgi:PAS domain S-box-containing protein
VSKPEPNSERAVIVAPNGRDAQIGQFLLREAGFFADVCDNLHALTESVEEGAGLAIIADDAIRGADLRPLSDFPFILLTQRGGGPERNPAAARLAEILGNVIFLERPFHPTTLISVVHTAVRGRRRQYEARKRLLELENGERHLQTALQAGHLGSWSLDVETMHLLASDSCRAHFGRDPEDSFGYAELLASVHSDDLSRMQARVQHTLRTGADYVIEYRNVWPDGSVHWIDARGRAQTDAAGRVTRLVGVSTDITIRKTAELERENLVRELAAEREALSLLSATLERRVEERTSELTKESAVRAKVQEQLLQSQKMESIGKLTGGVAHDFNNLLMAVMGNLDLLRRRLPEDARTLRLIDGAMQGAKRGAALTQRMLAFARQQDLETAIGGRECAAHRNARLVGARAWPTDCASLRHSARSAVGTAGRQSSRARRPQSRNQCARCDVVRRYDRYCRPRAGGRRPWIGTRAICPH